ncbi:ATP-binding protein [Achromobacter insuavis]|uniref:ATP-binding protein n=1 Tax=Achromobacter insuavis TaxID=1287735 RepID=UPI001F12E1A0|nr:ATP-binding protein [Achromobacter insuavis]
MATVRIGTDFWEKRKNRDVPIVWDQDRLSNHHVGVAGTSGAGKTHWIREFVLGQPNDVEVDIFDYHGDIEIPGAQTVLFSEANRFGYNPLVLNQDQHFGGVRRAVADVIEAINGTTRQLGGNQEGVLRNLLIDTYMSKGIFADNPRTWAKREGTEAEVRALFERRDWAGLRELYPSLADVISIGRRKLKALWVGIEDKDAGRQSLTAFDEFCRAMGAVHQARTKANKAGASGGAADQDALEKKAGAAKDKAIEAFKNFLDRVDNGRDFDEVIKYNSKDVLLSVITRLENLVATGMFNPNPPPFGQARVRRYVLTPMAQSEDELKMFVRFRLRSIIREEMQRGEAGGRLRRMVVIDESKKFNDESASNPINVIVNEMRKFGLSILLAGQSPTHFSSDFIKGAGTLLLLNLATDDWNDAARRLKIEVDDLKYLRPQQTGAVRMLEKGEAATFRRVSFK